MKKSLASDVISRQRRALVALDGLSIGDAFGQRFFAPGSQDWIRKRMLPPGPWRYTDDTEMALGLHECLARLHHVQQDELAKLFADRYHRDSRRGYGGTIQDLLRGIHTGGHWRDLSQAAFEGQGSMGNGSAMRVGVLGAYFADDLDLLVDQARLSAEVTHAHEDGIAGAIATAVATALMWHPPFNTEDFFRTILDRTPSGSIWDSIARVREFSISHSIEAAVASFGNGSCVICSDTIPLCLWLVARHPGNYEEALWSAVTAEGVEIPPAQLLAGFSVAGMVAPRIRANG